MRCTLERSIIDHFLYRWDPRFKFISLMALVFVFSFVHKPMLLLFIALISFLIYSWSRLSWGYWVARMRIPFLFVLFISIFLVLFSGNTALFNIGFLSIREEGLLLALTIITRFLSIMTIMIVLFATTSISNLIRAMQTLGLPSIMADMTLFFYRYLFEINKDMQTMQTAMRVRGFNYLRAGNLGYLASLAGALLVRSYEQSDIVYSAMTLRGYGQETSFQQKFEPRSEDYSGFAVTGFLSLFIVVGQIYLS